MQLLHFKVSHKVCMHQFGWLSERGGNFLNLFQKECGTQKGWVPSEKGGGYNLREKLWQLQDLNIFVFLLRLWL